VQLATLAAQRAEAETVAAAVGGTPAGQAGGLLPDDTALAGKEGRGALPWQG